MGCAAGGEARLRAPDQGPSSIGSQRVPTYEQPPPEGDGLLGDGSVAVGWSITSSPGVNRAFRYTPGLPMQDLGSLISGGSSQGMAVNSSGGAVVGWSSVSAGNQHAFRWTAAAGMQDLGVLAPDTYSCADAIRPEDIPGMLSPGCDQLPEVVLETDHEHDQNHEEKRGHRLAVLGSRFSIQGQGPRALELRTGLATEGTEKLTRKA